MLRGPGQTKALYEWDYGKQLLYTQILREKVGLLVADIPTLSGAVDAIAAEESIFFSERFLAPRPLLDAIRSAEPVVMAHASGAWILGRCHWEGYLGSLG